MGLSRQPFPYTLAVVYSQKNVLNCVEFASFYIFDVYSKMCNALISDLKCVIAFMIIKWDEQ